MGGRGLRWCVRQWLGKGWYGMERDVAGYRGVGEVGVLGVFRERCESYAMGSKRLGKGGQSGVAWEAGGRVWSKAKVG